jgi:hypothetical protein
VLFPAPPAGLRSAATPFLFTPGTLIREGDGSDPAPNGSSHRSRSCERMVSEIQQGSTPSDSESLQLFDMIDHEAR